MKDKKKIFYINIIFLFLFICVGIILVNFLNPDGNWDFMAYHYYSVYALFHNRIGFDIMPVGIQSYLNPLMDIPFYILLKYLNHHPRILMSIQSLYYGVCAFLVYLMAKNVFVSRGFEKKFFVFFAVIIGITGHMAIIEVGSTFNDLIISLFVLLALLILSKQLFRNDSKKRTFLLTFAGLLFGIACGLKATCVLYFSAAIASLIFMCRSFEKPFKIISLITITGIIGYLISNGWWMYILYSNFQNPFFPYYNNIFKSEYAPWVSHMDIRHLPRNICQWIFYPFYFGGYSYENIASEFAHIDYRYIALYITFFFLFTGNIIFAKIKPSFCAKLQELINLPFVNFLILFLFFSYIFWLKTSSTLRYILPLEMLSGIYIAILVVYMLVLTQSRKITYISGVFILGLLLFSTRYAPQWMTRDCRGFCENFMEIPDLKLPDNAIVCILGGYPTQIFIPFQNPKARFIYLRGECPGYAFIYNKRGEERIKKIINDPSKKIYLLYSIAPVAPLEWDFIKNFINPDDYDCRQVKECSYYIPQDRMFYFCTFKDKN